MTENRTLLFVAIPILFLLVYWNNEVYEHRTNMKEAEEAFNKGNYAVSLKHLEDASGFPFHMKTKPYIENVIRVQHANHVKGLNERMNKEKELTDYVRWVETSVLGPVTKAYSQYDYYGDYDAKKMNQLFYQMNFKLQDKEVGLDSKFMKVHSHLIEYTKSNQLAYGAWDRKEFLEAEEFRQSAIESYTEFRKELSKLSRTNCGKGYDLSVYVY